LRPAIDAGVDLAFDAAEPQATTYARANAPWTDRTGNARNGLFATHEPEPMVRHSLIIYHTMPYGVWLEVRWSGRYAIIGPTMFHIAPLLAAQVAEAVNRSIERLGR
jgi:diacylglycerol kinase